MWTMAKENGVLTSEVEAAMQRDLPAYIPNSKCCICVHVVTCRWHYLVSSIKVHRVKASRAAALFVDHPRTVMLLVLTAAVQSRHLFTHPFHTRLPIPPGPTYPRMTGHGSVVLYPKMAMLRPLTISEYCSPANVLCDPKWHMV